MPLSKVKGNMYQGWVTHCHSHLRGACPHGCSYCYVKAIDKRFGRSNHAGPVRLDEKELAVNYGTGKTIFIEHTNDLFAVGVPDEFIVKILRHCRAWKNYYVFQTKNPSRVTQFYDELPHHNYIGTTIETNRYYPKIMGRSPLPAVRAEGMARISKMSIKFVTVEPILNFDVEELVKLIATVQPEFVNLGADSKGHGLPEPSWRKVVALIGALDRLGIEIRQKSNLTRLKGVPDEH